MYIYFQKTSLHREPSLLPLKIKKKKIWRNHDQWKFHPYRVKKKKERNREREENFPWDRESALLGKWLDPLSLFSRCYKNAFHYFYRLETKKEKRKSQKKRERIQEKKGKGKETAVRRKVSLFSDTGEGEEEEEEGGAWGQGHVSRSQVEERQRRNVRVRTVATMNNKKCARSN